MDRPTVRHRGRLPDPNEMFDTSSADTSSATARADAYGSGATQGDALSSFNLRGSAAPLGPLAEGRVDDLDEMSDTLRGTP